MTSGATVSWARVLLATACSLVSIWIVLSVLDALGEPGRDSMEAWNDRKWVLPVVAFGGAMAAWLLYFAHLWPLVSMNDTWIILRSPLEAAVQHPLSYNVTLALLVKVGTWLGGGELWGFVLAAFVQMVLWAGALSLLVGVLQRFGVARRILWLLVAYFAASPLVADYSFALVKDSAFSVFVILLLPVLLVLYATRGRVLNDPWWFFLSFVSLVGFATMRNNGLVALLPLVALIVFYSLAERRRAVLLGVLAFTLAMVPSVLTSKYVGKQRFVEAVGVPLQMVGYTVVNDADCLPENTREYFEEVMPRDSWVDAYNPVSVDPTKDSAAFNHALIGDRSLFLTEFFRGAMACPKEFASGYALHTATLWRVDAPGVATTGGQSVFTSVVSNYPSSRDQLIQDYADRGIVNHSLLGPLDSVVGGAFDLGIRHSPGPGTWMWLGILSIFGFAYRKRHEWLALYAPTILIWGTLLLATPTPNPFRYVAPVIVVVPTAFAVLLGTPSIKRLQKDAPRLGGKASVELESREALQARSLEETPDTL